MYLQMQSIALHLHRPLLSRRLKNFIDIFSRVLSRSRGYEGKQGTDCSPRATSPATLPQAESSFTPRSGVRKLRRGKGE